MEKLLKSFKSKLEYLESSLIYFSNEERIQGIIEDRIAELQERLKDAKGTTSKIGTGS